MNDVIANLRATSRQADSGRLRQYREDIRSAVGGLRNVREFPAHYDSRYRGGAAAVERIRVAYLRRLWADFRAFAAYLRGRRA